MSASAHARGHAHAAAWGLALLDWLESHGRRVVNGSRVARLEISKAAQHAALARHGLTTPRTRLVCGKERLLAEAEAFGEWPVILKPNQGGRGLGVRLFRDAASLASYASSPDYETPVDGLWLLQRYAVSSDGTITRVEFVGGELLYAVRVDASQGFDLCPADSCSVGDAFCPVGEEAPRPRFEIRLGFSHPLVERYRGFLEAEGIDVAGIEFVQDAAGRTHTYDINTNTNYNHEAEQNAGVSGARTVARFLSRELERCAAVSS
jgi:biotin carboxylase